MKSDEQIGKYDQHSEVIGSRKTEGIKNIASKIKMNVSIFIFDAIFFIPSVSESKEIQKTWEAYLKELYNLRDRLEDILIGEEGEVEDDAKADHKD